MTENLKQTIIEKDVHDELLWVTTGKYALFMSYGKTGIDAMALYMHYQFTATLQATNSVWAADRYCRQGLDWGRDRFEKAKALLIELGIIEVKQSKTEQGKFGKIYIKIKRSKAQLEPNDLDRLPEKPQAVKPACVETTTNALSKKVNALSKNLNASSDSFNTFWLLYDKKTNNKKCLAKWQKIKPELHETIFNHVKEYVKSTPDKKFRKNPETYLNNSGWEDEIVYPKGTPKPVEQQQDDFKKLCEANKKYFD